MRKAGVRSYAFPARLGRSRRLFLWLTGEGRRSARSFTDRRLWPSNKVGEDARLAAMRMFPI